MLENLSQLILGQVTLPHIVLAHTFSTVYMLGVIYFVQLVHYPLFAQVGPRFYLDYHQKHVFWTTWVVGPPMLIEAFTTCLLLLLGYSGIEGINFVVHIWGTGLLFIIWLSTALIQVPCHERLINGFDQQVHRRLVNSNWLRTISWSLRTVLALYIQASF